METSENADSVRGRELLREITENRNQGRDDLANTLCGECLYLARRAGDRKLESRALLAMADLIFHYNPGGQDPFARRRDLCEEALALCLDIGDDAGASAGLRLLASTHMGKKGGKLLEEALNLAESSGDKRQIADTLERMSANLGLRDSARAIQLAERALAMYRELDDLPRQAIALFGLSILTMGPDPEKSREFAMQALEIHRKLGHKKQIAQSLMFLWCGRNDDRSREREEALEEGRALTREIGVACWEASFMENLADIAEARGDRVRAEKLRAEAARIDDSPKLDPEELKALEEAFGSGDRDAAQAAVRGAFFGAAADEDHGAGDEA